MKNFDFGNIDINLDDFNVIDGLDNEFGGQSRYIKPKRIKEIPEKRIKYAYAEKLAEDIKIDRGSRYFVIVDGSFIFADFFEAIAVKNNWKIKEMTISTLSLGEPNVDSLANLINGGYLEKLNIIVSDYFFSHERGNLVPYIYEELDKPTQNNPDGCFQLAVAGTHCKTVIIETECGLFITAHGSANMRSSGNIEQFQIEENKELYLFNKAYQDNIIEEYKTIKKAVRSRSVWNAVTKGDNTNG